MVIAIDYKYYEWLISQIDYPKNKSYKDLFERMHNFEFIWFVPNDDNRIHDALDLRNEFLDRTSNKLSLNGASILEIIVSLSRHVAFISGIGNEYTWAWKLIKNLHLHKMTDPLSIDRAQKIDDILYALVWRTYDSNGQGGFFPLKNPHEDQRKVEIWYQLNAYLIEMDGN